MRNWLINILKRVLIKLDTSYYKGPSFSVTSHGIWPVRPIKEKSSHNTVDPFTIFRKYYLEAEETKLWIEKAKKAKDKQLIKFRVSDSYACPKKEVKYYPPFKPYKQQK